MTGFGGDVERRQFRRLLKLSFGRLMDAAVASREIAAEYFVIWSAALLLTPPLFYTVKRTSAYPPIGRHSLDLLQQVALTDRLFFVVWSMLAAALIVSVLWEALLPDRTDQQILGVLPVRSRTIAAARLVAALGAGLGFTVAIALPAAVLYALSGATHAVIGTVPTIFVGHLAATVLAGMFVFCALLFVRGLVVAIAGSALSSKLAVLIQFLTVVLLVESFMFLPAVASGIARDLMLGATDLRGWPPVWFIAVYAGLAGPRAAATADAASYGWLFPFVMLVLASAAYVLPARINARRAIESRDAGARSAILPRLLTLVARGLLREPAARAIFRFTLASVLRNQRPLLTVAAYLGLGVAMAGTRLVSATIRNRPLPLDAPYDYLIAVPLVLSFALVLGLRSACSTPTDLPANWSFRLTSMATALSCRTATSMALVVLGVVPVTFLTLTVGSVLWGVPGGAAVALMHLVSGAMLCELVAPRAGGIPFTRTRVVDPTALKVGVPVTLVGLNLFAFRLDDVQMLALRSFGGVACYVAAALMMAAAIRAVGRRRDRGIDLRFEASEELTTQLRLSESAG